MGDLRRSGGNMGFLRKRTNGRFGQFGIGGLLSISVILILVLVLRRLIISFYVNLLAISRLPFPAIRGDFPERCFDEDRNSKSKIRILSIQILSEDQLSIENRMSIIEIRIWQMWKIQKAEIPNRVTGVPSPHLITLGMKIFQIFFLSFS